MAYNFLTLTNDVCKRLNEVQLTQANFGAATSQYSSIKDAVNYSLRDINQQQYEWPFNYTTHTETLVPGQARYTFPADFKTCSMDTFRIQRDSNFNNETTLLRSIQYEEYLNKYIDQEYNTTDESIRDTPVLISRAPNLSYTLYPAPDEAYSLDYEYYTLPTDLVLSGDVPTAPEQFRTVIIEGAMYYMYTFRSDTENAQMSGNKFQQLLKDLRSVYINRYEYMKSTMIEGRRYSTYSHRRD